MAVTNIFVNGTTADADEVNTNFAEALTILAGYDTTGGNHTNTDTVATQIGETGAITSGQATYVIKAHFYIKRTVEYTLNATATVKLYRGDAFIGATEIASDTLQLIVVPANSGDCYQSDQNVLTMMYVETTGANFSGSEKVWASVTYTWTDAANLTVYCKWIEVVGYGK